MVEAWLRPAKIAARWRYGFAITNLRALYFLKFFVFVLIRKTADVYKHV